MSRLGGREDERPSVWHLFTLYQFGIAQPVFHLLASHADFFVAHRAEAWDPKALAAIVYLVPVALVVGVGRLGTLLPIRLHRFLHSTLLTVLGAAFLLPAAKDLPFPASGVVTLALAGGIAIALAAGLAFLSQILRWAAPLSLFFPIMFLFFSPVRSVGRDGAEVAAAKTADPAEVDQRPPVIVVVLDELPLSSILNTEDQIDASRFPALAELARHSIWFRNASTVSDVTNEAVPALLTGLYPERHRLGTVSEYPTNLFTLLGLRDRTHAIELLTRLCPVSLCGADEARRPGVERIASELRDTSIAFLHVTLPAAYTASLPSIAGTWRDFGRRTGHESTAELPDPKDPKFATVRRDRSVADFERFLAGLRADSEPGALHFLHLELPHIPWRFLDSGLEYGPISRSAFAHGVDAEGVWVGTAWQITQGLQRHLLQTVFVDSLIERLIRTLHQTGLWDRALLIVTADHGLAFQAGQPGRTPTRANALEIMAVPLFIRTPHMETGKIDDRNAELIDLLPTVIEFLQGELDQPVDGRSLLAPETERLSKRLILGDEVWSLAAGTRPARLAAARRIEAAFGRDTGVEGIYRIGRIAPRQDLIGRPLADLRQDAGGCRVLFDEPWSFDRVGWTPGFLPAHISARILDCHVGVSAPVAVAVNGVISATTWTFMEGAATRFTAMVHPRAFSDGANIVEAFAIEDMESAEPVLRKLSDRSRIRYRIEDAPANALRLVASNGTAAIIEPGAVVGEIVREGQLFSGWAEDPTGKQPFVALLVFVDGELVHSMPSGGFPIVGPNADRARNPDRAGIRFMMPMALMPRPESEIRIFAVNGPVGPELPVRKSEFP